MMKKVLKGYLGYSRVKLAKEAAFPDINLYRHPGADFRRYNRLIPRGDPCHICINIILAISLNLVTGLPASFPGPCRFMSIGAYTCAIIILRMHSLPRFHRRITGAVLAAIVDSWLACPH